MFISFQLAHKGIHEYEHSVRFVGTQVFFLKMNMSYNEACPHLTWQVIGNENIAK